MREASDLEEVLQQTFGWTALAALALAILSGAVTSRGFLRRVEAINATTRAIIAGGDMAARIPVRGSHDEFDVLAANLNAMLTRIQALVEGLRQVSSDIAHDLRTPLTHLRQRLELARGQASSEPERQLGPKLCKVHAFDVAAARGRCRTRPELGQWDLRTRPMSTSAVAEREPC